MVGVKSSSNPDSPGGDELDELPPRHVVASRCSYEVLQTLPNNKIHDREGTAGWVRVRVQKVRGRADRATAVGMGMGMHKGFSHRIESNPWYFWSWGNR